jgi:hypothetical protein
LAACWLVVRAILAWCAPHQDLVLENLPLRHLLAALTRPTHARPCARLRLQDKLIWLLARRFCAASHDDLRIVTPDTVVRRRGHGRRLFRRCKSRSRGGCLA